VTFDRTPDGDLYRKVTETNGTATAIRYGAGNLILDDSGVATSQTLLIGALLATLDLVDPGQSGYRLTTLQGGHALLALDAQGQAQNLSTPSLYGPWGEPINPPAADPEKPLYGWQAANLLETAGGLVLMGERTYLPALGRFTSLDPVFGGGINGYNYASNDPINNNDPNGTDSTTIIVVAGGSSGGILGGLLYFAKATQASTPPPQVASGPRPRSQSDPVNYAGSDDPAAIDRSDPNFVSVQEPPNDIAALNEEIANGKFDGVPEGEITATTVTDEFGIETIVFDVAEALL